MSQQLINRSSDLKALRDEGFEVTVIDNHLVVSSIPYVNANKEVAFGRLISELTLSAERTARPGTHVVHFVGDSPCHLDGSKITSISHQESPRQLSSSLRADRSFSNKDRQNPDRDYRQKMLRYIGIISEPAIQLDPEVNPRTFRPVLSDDPDTEFVYQDTNSSRSEILALTDKLKGQKIGVIGLGGTGSYVLDAVAKTPVREIHLYDADSFLQHNAFRAPGAPTLEELESKPAKVEHWAKIYGRMHQGIRPHVREVKVDMLDDMVELDFIFVCIDVGSTKRGLFAWMERKGIPFVDVGMGLKIVDGRILGLVRATSCTEDHSGHLSECVDLNDNPDDAYQTNIQIAELNMLNAALAVIRWKKHYGFFHDHVGEHQSVYTLDTNHLVNAFSST